MPLYFAYGSNMSPRQMQARCPGARFVGTAVLQGWRFIIAVRGGANIVRAPGCKVHGVLWQVRREHIAALNRWEGVAQGVYRRRMISVDTDRRLASAITYIARRNWPGHGSVNYIVTAILPGAEAFELPQAYREELAGWLAPRPIGPRTVRYRGRRSRRRKARQLL